MKEEKVENTDSTTDHTIVPESHTPDSSIEKMEVHAQEPRVEKAPEPEVHVFNEEKHVASDTIEPKKQTQHHNQDHEDDFEEDDGFDIDFSGLKQKAKGLFSREQTEREEKEEEDQEFSFNVSNIFTKKNAKWLIPVLCIIIAIVVSTNFRFQSSYLPITESWAENTVEDFYRNNIQNQINQQYPNLPQQNREALIQRHYQEAREQNKQQIEQEIQTLANQFRSQFQDENGDTYLLAIDPYLWYGEARNVLRHGHLGDVMVNGESHYSLRDGRLPKKSSIQLHPYVGAYLFKLLAIFDRDISLMRAMFLLPMILINLALIPAFFIARRISGNVGGLFAAVFLAVNGPLLGRTPAGFADTDPYNILLPLLIAWLFLEAYMIKNKKHKWILLGLAGLAVGIFSTIWTGWSYSFLMVLATMGIASVIRVVIEFVKNKYKFSMKIINNAYIKNQLICFIGFFVSSGIFVTLFRNSTQFFKSFIRPIQFIALKEVGVKSIWPNVLTTVAEFNEVSFSNIINQLGGKFLFFIAVLGLLLILYKNYKDGKHEYLSFCLIGVWFGATAFSFTRGVRFAILMAPPFAIAVGISLGIIYRKSTDYLHKGFNIHTKVGAVVVILILALTLVGPFGSAENIARNEVPSMNDAWYNTLTKIKNDASDAVITSWWDFGHWFAAISERRVTFDGGDQGERIHWVGRSLLTSDENEARGILHMLNCAQETAPHTLEGFGMSSLEAVQLIKQVILIKDTQVAIQKYQEAGLTQEQIDIMIEQTHCQDLIPNYYITSEDMIGKGGVWGHFGSWNFEKATMYFNTNKLSRSDAVTYLTTNFDMSEEEAHRIHGEIQTTKGDRWIAPWPGYISSPQRCDEVNNGTVRCVTSVQGQGVAIRIDLTTYDAYLEHDPNVKPNTVVYVDGTEVKEKRQEGGGAGFAAVLIPNGEQFLLLLTAPEQGAGMFTRMFFLNGHGLDCFSKFDDVQQVNGGRIATWKVDYACGQENNVYSG